MQPSLKKDTCSDIYMTWPEQEAVASVNIFCSEAKVVPTQLYLIHIGSLI